MKNLTHHRNSNRAGALKLWCRSKAGSRAKRGVRGGIKTPQLESGDGMEVNLGEVKLPHETDLFALYIRDIGKKPLLSPEQQRTLAKKIAAGNEQARIEMIEGNLRLVVKIARDYEGYGLALVDLINEGNIGLMTAVERFDPDKGAKLSTYAAWWIKQAIKRALANQSKTIRLPVHVVDKLFNIRRAERKLEDILGREPTSEEIGQESGLRPAHVAELKLAAFRPSSLNAPLGDEDSNSIGDVIADENARTPYDNLANQADVDMVKEMLACLDPREIHILHHRFGLDGNTEQTLEEIGQRLHVTRERIRQVQEIALAKLRKMVRKRQQVMELV